MDRLYPRNQSANNQDKATIDSPPDEKVEQTSNDAEEQHLEEKPADY